jgi:multiple sugar transport system permease protein
MAGAIGELDAVHVRRRRGLATLLEGERPLGYLLLLPAVLYIALLVGVPFLLALRFSFSNVTTGSENLTGEWVGLDNFRAAMDNPLFWKALRNTFIFTFASEIIKGVLGLALAFLLIQPFRGRAIVRALVIIPWAMPVAISAIAWKWMLDPNLSVFNWVLNNTPIINATPLGDHYHNWRGDPNLAFASVILVNVWRGLPFSAIILMAGLTAVPQDLIDSARVEGAGFLTRWRKIIVPIIAPILFISLLFSVIFTFTDFSIVYLLTNSGPGDATYVLPTLAFQTGVFGGALGRGAAISLFMLPVLMAVAVWLLRLLKQREGQ